MLCAPVPCLDSRQCLEVVLFMEPFHRAFSPLVVPFQIDFALPSTPFANFH